MDEDSEYRIEQFISWLKEITEEERSEAMFAIHEKFCKYCYRETHGQMCHCWNDE